MIDESLVLLHCIKDKVGTKVAVQRLFFSSGKQCCVHPFAITFQLKTSHDFAVFQESVVFFVVHFHVTVALSKT